MGKKEEILLEYLSQAEIIADLFNGFVFQGEQIVLPEMLKELNSRERLLLDDYNGERKKNTYEILKRERDIVREVVIDNRKMRLMICGVEQQTNIDYSMPLRVLAYDTLEYLKQAKQIERHHRREKDVTGKEFLSMFTRDDKLVPTITIVFYTGKEKWDGVLELAGLFEQGTCLEQLYPYMIHAPLNLIHIYDVKNVNHYHSSLKQIFEIVSVSDDEEKLMSYINNHKNEISCIDDITSKMISVLLDFELTQEMECELKEGNYNMCKAIEDMKNNSREEGREEGREEIVLNMLRKNMPIEEISELTGVELGKVLEISSELK